MDKIQEQHFEACLSFLSARREAPKHAAITEDMMGRFAEWAEVNGWRYDEDVKEWRSKSYYWQTTSELIQLFKQTL